MTDTTPEAVAVETLRSWTEWDAAVKPAQAVVAIHSAAAMIEALAADRDAQKARADAMQRSYEDLYADALADAQSDAQEFEGDLWKLLREYLTELNLDWSNYTEDGITAEQAIEHIRECMEGETARADAAEERLREWQANQHYRYIGLDGKTVLASDLEARAEAAEAKVKALVEAATVLHWSMELFFEADEAADEAEREGRQKEAARLRNMATGRWQSIPGSLDALAAALRGEGRG